MIDADRQRIDRDMRLLRRYQPINSLARDADGHSQYGE